MALSLAAESNVFILANQNTLTTTITTCQTTTQIQKLIQTCKIQKKISKVKTTNKPTAKRTRNGKQKTNNNNQEILLDITQKITIQFKVNKLKITQPRLNPKTIKKKI